MLIQPKLQRQIIKIEILQEAEDDRIKGMVGITQITDNQMVPNSNRIPQ